jgi:type IV pilus assembly protein PilC
MQFFYEAVNDEGEAFVGKLEGVDEADVQHQLLNLGWSARSIAPVQEIQAETQPEVELTRVLTPGSPAAAQQLGAEAAAPAIVSAAQSSIPAAASVVLPQSAPPVMSQGQVSITYAGNAARVRGRSAPARSRAPAAAQDTRSKMAGVSTRELLFFFQQLASLVRSGISIYSALESLAPRTPNRNLAQTAREMMAQAQAGGAISDVMQRYPAIYPEHIVGLVRAGELGGFLEIALGEIADHFESNIALYRGSWIPKTLAVQALFLLALAQPLFTSLFGANLDVTTFLASYLIAATRNIVIALLVLCAAKAGSIWLNKPANRRLRDGWALKLPPYGDLQRQTALATFARVLRRLYAAGVAPSAAWEGAMNSTTNTVLRERLNGAHLLMQQGQSLADAFVATGLFPDHVEQLIVTGTRSGEVVESLDRIEKYYGDAIGESTGKVRFAVLRLGCLAMLILSGAAVCWMFYSYFHGMFDFVDKNFATP